MCCYFFLSKLPNGTCLSSKQRGYFFSFGPAMRHVGSRSPTRDRVSAPALGAWSLNQWTAREVGEWVLFFFFLLYFLIKENPS